MFEKSVVVEAPIAEVYERWTDFESFPEFMEGIEEVRPIGNSRLKWKAEIAGVDKEWEAVVMEQVPEKVVSWGSVSGAFNQGQVHFRAASPAATEISLRIDYRPDGPVEKVGDMAGVVSHRVGGDLKRFKEMIESNGHSVASDHKH